LQRQDLWGKLEQLMLEAQASLFNENLVDDDQTLFLLAYLFEAELFQLHSIPDHQRGYDPFVLFNNFNTTGMNKLIIFDLDLALITPENYTTMH
jgi:hypothetical protein